MWYKPAVRFLEFLKRTRRDKGCSGRGLSGPCIAKKTLELSIHPLLSAAIFLPHETVGTYSRGDRASATTAGGGDERTLEASAMTEAGNQWMDAICGDIVGVTFIGSDKANEFARNAMSRGSRDEEPHHYLCGSLHRRSCPRALSHAAGNRRRPKSLDPRKKMRRRWRRVARGVAGESADISSDGDPRAWTRGTMKM